MAKAVALFVSVVFTLAGLSVVGPASGSAVSSGSGKARVIAFPKPGSAVRSHLVKLRVRAKEGDLLTARLNGKAIGIDFDRPRGGIRKLTVSASHGLRRGRNLLKVSVAKPNRAPRRAKIRFRVRTRRPLVGAGRDRRLSAGVRTRLAARILPRKVARHSGRVRWKVLRAPRGAGAGSRSGRLKGLGSRTSRTTAFRPTIPGKYRLRLTVGRGGKARSDRINLNAVSPNLMVPIDTMTGNRSKPGIRLGKKFYPTPETHPLDSDVSIQILVLNRQTLGFVSNSSFIDLPKLQRFLKGLDDGKLVIAAQQATPGTGGEVPHGLRMDRALAPIGFPKVDLEALAIFPDVGGRVSAIGVPGMAQGDAEVRFHFHYGGEMKGYLSPDQWGSYGFISTTRHSIKHDPPRRTPCTPGTAACDRNGYWVHQLDPYTGESIGVSFFNTNGRGLSSADLTAQAHYMTETLNRWGKPGQEKVGPLVTIVSQVSRATGEANYRPPVGAIGKSPMKVLAAAVAAVGGTRNAFNASSRVSAPADGGDLVYYLSGWAGAGEGAGAEAASGVNGIPSKFSVDGSLQPNRENQLRPTGVTTNGDDAEALPRLILDEPTAKWPLDDNPGASKALAYLGSTDKRLGRDPRSAYWIQNLDEADTNAIIAKLGGVSYPSKTGFSKADFAAAKAELIKELGWVGNVRRYMVNLSSPFADGGFTGWADAETIAHHVFQDATQPKNSAAFRWSEFTEIILRILGPLTAGATTEVAALLNLGVWAFGSTQAGLPTESEVQVKADQLGNELARQAQSAMATYSRMGDLIVSDYAKLSVVGPNANCDPSSPDCQKEFQFTRDERIAASSAVYRGVERLAWVKLLPLGFHTFRLIINGEPGGYNGPRYSPPNVHDYSCFPWYHAFYYLPENASTSLEQVYDPSTGIKKYQTFALGAPPSATTNHATPPPEDVLKRMFGSVSHTNDPLAGGLGIPPQEFMAESPHFWWEGTQYFENARCIWDH